MARQTSSSSKSLATSAATLVTTADDPPGALGGEDLRHRVVRRQDADDGPAEHRYVRTFEGTENREASGSSTATSTSALAMTAGRS